MKLINLFFLCMLIGAVLGCESCDDDCINGICMLLPSNEGYGCLCSSGYSANSSDYVADCIRSRYLLKRHALCDTKTGKSS
jgi:hypothetical protein